MPHRKSLRLYLYLSLFVGGLVCSTTLEAAHAADDQRPPNIVFILIDDMGWPDLSCYGNKFNESPHIDKLAAGGMRFTDFYAATPVCSSTRSTIMAGQYSARTGITDFILGHWRPFEKLVVPEVDHQLPPDIKTPGDALKAAGYATGYFGKWHLGGTNNQPQHHGFDVTENVGGGAAFRRERGSVPAGPKRIDLLTDYTNWFIESHKDKPFFVFLSHHAVHIRVETTSDALGKFKDKTKPTTGVNNPAYAGMIENLDASVGRIIAKLDALKLSDNTVVIVTSDNGGLRKIYTGVGDVISTNAPLRDEKGTIYEGGIRVPFIVRWPGVVEPGTVCNEPTTTADLLSTFCAIGSAKLPDQPIDGADMTPLFKDAASSLGRDSIYFHYPHYHHSRPASAIRSGDWKLIEWFEDGSLELYNLKNDLGETTNLVSRQADKAKAMQAELAAWRTTVGARLPTENPKYDADKAAQWWSRRNNKPLDIEAMARRYKTANPVTPSAVNK